MNEAQVLSARQVADVRQVWEIGCTQACHVYLVGGVVRDLLLGHSLQQKDLDFIIEGDASALARQVARARGAECKIFPQFLTAKVVGEGESGEIDFATARTEVYEAPGSLPQVRAADIGADLRRRDFSINAIALPAGALLASIEQNRRDFAAHCIDPFDGRQDLSRRLIRILHEASFLDDPTRMFRALRYQARIEGALEANTADLLESALRADVFGTVSPVRQLNELRKVCEEARWHFILQLLDEREMLVRIGLAAGSIAPAFSGISARADRLSPDPLYQAVLSACYFSLKEGEREKVFSEKGFGRKLFRRFSEERSAIAAGAAGLSHLSGASLLYLASAAPDADMKTAAFALAEERQLLHRRGAP